MPVIRSRFVLNQMSIDLVVRRGGASEIEAAVERWGEGRPIRQGPVGGGAWCANQRGITAKKDWDVIRPRGGEGVRPL